MELKKSLLNNFVFYFNLIYKKGLSYGFAGNGSIRIKDTIYITPSGSPKENLKLRDLIKFKLKEKIPENASSEADFHLWIYKNFKKINTIFHAHTLYVNFYFKKKRKIPEDEALKKQNILIIMSENWKEKIKSKMNEKIKILHVINHGSFSLGKDPAESFSIIEHFENLCKIEFLKDKKFSIKDSQNIIYETYYKRDFKRGLLKNVLWFSEEVGELLQAIRKGKREKIKEEISDVYAWLLTLANLLGVDLEEEFKKRYYPFCPKCQKSPCECEED